MPMGRPSPLPCCHPGLVPGSRPAPDRDPGKAGRERRLTVWTPEQVRGDNRGQGRKARARRKPCPDPADGLETRLYQRLATGPAHLNRTAVDLFRASTSIHRFACSRLAPRCRETWMPGTSPGMTWWGAVERDRNFRNGTPGAGHRRGKVRVARRRAGRGGPLGPVVTGFSVRSCGGGRRREGRRRWVGL